jgi:hypothetical protein
VVDSVFQSEHAPNYHQILKESEELAANVALTFGPRGENGVLPFAKIRNMIHVLVSGIGSFCSGCHSGSGPERAGDGTALDAGPVGLEIASPPGRHYHGAMNLNDVQIILH